MKITFIGGGSFGTALALGISKNFDDILIYERKAETIKEINENHTNKKYLDGINLSQNIKATADFDIATLGRDIIVLSVPSSAIREISKRLKEKDLSNTILVSIAKGIDPDKLIPLSEVIYEETNIHPVILSGPSHAEEVAQYLPTTLVASSKNEKSMKIIQGLFSTPNLRVYTNNDLIGVEIGGAVKNIIALGAGICDGIGYGDNTKAALMTRGMSEIIRIGLALGANQETFYGLTGIGDLIVTCTSMHSRNRRCGVLIGQGKSVEESIKEVGMVVEGIKATRSFYELSHKLNIEMPITQTMYNVIFKGYNPKDSADLLMLRDLKEE